jgi:hypothetical protein
MPMEPIRVTYVMDEKEALRAIDRIHPGRRWIALGLALFGILNILGASFEMIRRQPATWHMLIGIALLAAGGFSYHHIRHKVRSMLTSDRRVRYEISDTEWRHLAPGVDARLPWPSFESAREVDDGFVLYVDEDVGHWLPKVAFASSTDLQRFRSLVAQKVPRKST